MPPFIYHAQDSSHARRDACFFTTRLFPLAIARSSSENAIILTLTSDHLLRFSPTSAQKRALMRRVSAVPALTTATKMECHHTSSLAENMFRRRMPFRCASTRQPVRPRPGRHCRQMRKFIFTRYVVMISASPYKYRPKQQACRRAVTAASMPLLFHEGGARTPRNAGHIFDKLSYRRFYYAL